MNDKKNILIAEDDQHILQMLLKGIMAKRYASYNTFVCMDGIETLESLHKHHINCLILDLNMNNLNGIQVLQVMQRHGQLEKIPVIVSSGFIDESMEMQLKSFGIKHLLKKPYPMDKLIESIDSLLLPKPV